MAASDALQPAQMRIVRNRSIPNVDSDRLQDSLTRIHDMVHTREGLQKWDAPRRGLYDYGMKSIAINAELRKRGETPSVEGCRWCSKD